MEYYLAVLVYGCKEASTAGLSAVSSLAQSSGLVNTKPESRAETCLVPDCSTPALTFTQSVSTHQFFALVHHAFKSL